MKLALIGGFCEIEEILKRIGAQIECIVGPDDDDAYIASADRSIPLLISPDGDLRYKVAQKFIAAGFNFATVVAKTADVSESAILEEGSVVAEHAIVNAKVVLGRFAKVNTAAKICHECKIGDFATIAPAAVLLGRVNVGIRAYIGANATVLPGLTIGERAVIGAGAVVTKDVPADETWAGVPARRQK